MSIGQKIKGYAVEIDGETTGLEAAMKRVGKAANDINKELAEVEKGLKFDPSNTVLIAQKQELLRQKIGETSKGLDALRQAQGQVEDMFKRGEIDDGTYRAFQREIATSESKLKTFEQQVKDTGQAQEKAGKSTDDFGDKMKKLAGAAVAAMAIAQVAGVVKDLVVQVINGADELQKMADKTGLSTERLQELQFIGQDLGVELDTISSAQAKLTKAMGQARDGAATQADAFDALGISIVDSNGNLRDAKDVMAEAMDALAGVGNETERDVLAQKLFGRGAQELNPIIRAGSAELNRLSQQARDTGAVMSEEAVTALDQFGDSMDHVKQSILAAIGTALAPLMPKLTELAGLVAEKVGPVLTWIAENIIPVVVGALSGEGGLGSALGAVMQIMGFAKDVFIMAWPIIQQAVQMFTDFFAGPSGQALIKGLLEAIGQALQILQQVFAQVWGAVQPIVQTFIDFLNSETGGKLIELFIGGVKVALTVLQELFEAAWPAMSAALELAKPIMEAACTAIEAAVWLVTKAVEALQDAWWWISGQSYKSDLREMRKNISEETKAAIADYEAMQAAFAKGAPSYSITTDASGKTTSHARGTITRGRELAVIGEAGTEVVAPVNDPARSADLLYRSGLLGKIAALAGGNVSSSSTSTSVRIDRLTIDGSKMSTSDLDGFIDSLQTALRMRTQPA